MKKINGEYNGFFHDNDYEKDCPGLMTVPTILPPVSRIVAIGDIHGDYDLAIRSFRLAQLIDENHQWIANPRNTIVVQVGDQIDSCRSILGAYDCRSIKYSHDKPEDLKIISFFDQMHQRAAVYGGAVYSLLGNHEMMNVQGNFQYVSYSNLHQFEYNDGRTVYRGKDGREKAFQRGGPLATHLACSRKMVLVIGSNLFVHAGILPVLTEKLKYLDLDHHDRISYLNTIVRKWLLNKISKNDNQIMDLILTNCDESPFWSRILGKIPPQMDMESAECEAIVKNALQVLQLGQIVIGHTPQRFVENGRAGINGTCYDSKGNNRLYRVDGGFAKAFQIFSETRSIQILEIINDNQFNIISE